MRMFVTFFARQAPASKKANPLCKLVYGHVKSTDIYNCSLSESYWTCATIYKRPWYIFSLENRIKQLSRSSQLTFLLAVYQPILAVSPAWRVWWRHWRGGRGCPSPPWSGSSAPPGASCHSPKLATEHFQKHLKGLFINVIWFDRELATHQVLRIWILKLIFLI